MFNVSKVTLIDSMGNDLTVVNAARVSMDTSHDVFDETSDTKLINYLAKHNHFTPFTHVQIQLRIQMPIFVARQWFKHTVGVSRNEVSRRYVSSPPEFYMPETFRHRPESSIKQGSGGDLSEELNTKFKKDYADLVYHSYGLYSKMIDDGVCPEQARMVLPQSMITEFYETASLSAYARICGLRLDGHAQKETRDVAVLINDICRNIAPISWSALCSY